MTDELSKLEADIWARGRDALAVHLEEDAERAKYDYEAGFDAGLKSGREEVQVELGKALKLARQQSLELARLRAIIEANENYDQNKTEAELDELREWKHRHLESMEARLADEVSAKNARLREALRKVEDELTYGDEQTALYIARNAFDETNGESK